MYTKHDVKINGGGDCTALRDELKSAIMELTDEEQREFLNWMKITFGKGEKQ